MHDPGLFAGLALACLLGLGAAAPWARPGRRAWAALLGAAVAGLAAHVLFGALGATLAGKLGGAALGAIGPGAGSGRRERARLGRSTGSGAPSGGLTLVVRV